MDRLVYTAMNGARNLMARQDILAHNLANAVTPGFRAEKSAFRSEQVTGPGLPTRVFAVETVSGADFSPGPLERTERPLDLAIEGPGWFAVQAPGGGEAYTRNGSFHLSAEGVLQTSHGHVVLGEAGPITMPAGHRVSIGRDGTVTAIPPGSAQNIAIAAGRLKLVNPPEAALRRGDDGLFRAGGGELPADPAVRVASGALESSNVNTVEALVGMITAARQYELQLKLVSAADENARRAGSLLDVSA